MNDKGRRVWDTANIKVVPKPEESKIEKKYPTVDERSYLKSHLQDKLNLDKNISKSVIVTNQSPKEEQGGYYCKSCDCTLKDSTSYLDHINGKKRKILKLIR